MKPSIASLLAAAAVSLAPAALAQTAAWTTTSVNLRAGPAGVYPIVAVLAPRTPVTVFGCVPDYLWCDVAAGPQRGWVYARNIAYSYNNREVLLPGIAAVIGIGIAAFILDDYWRDHYVDRSWYPDRRRWVRPPPPPPAVRPVPQFRQPPPRGQAAPVPRVQPGARPRGRQPGGQGGETAD